MQKPGLATGLLLEYATILMLTLLPIDLASKAPSLGSVDLQGLTILDDGALLCVSTYIPSGLV